MGEGLGWIAENLRGLAVPVTELHADPANARTGHDVRRIAESLKAYGQRKPLVANRAEGGKVEAGNGTLAAALKLGWTHVAVVWVDDDPATAAAFGIADNRTGELSRWDADALGKLAEVTTGLFTAFEGDELAEMLGVKPAGTADAEPQVDRAAELNEKWQVQPGDMFAIGQHRLICGDCTDRAVVERVMGGERAEMIWTDPPYGVAVGDKNKYLNSIAPSNRVEENLQNDTLDEDGLVAMLRSSFDNAIEHCTAGAAWYVAAPAVPLHVLFGQVLKDRNIWRQTIQWVKNNATFSPMGVCYHWQAEPIFFGWIPDGAHRYYGGRTQTTVWQIDRPLASPEHPTMKPVELVVRAVENSSRHGEIVLDPFLGSGTTMVACENLGRRCRGIEISPNYCAVALERMATAFPGIVIERVGE